MDGFHQSKNWGILILPESQVESKNVNKDEVVLYVRRSDPPSKFDLITDQAKIWSYNTSAHRFVASKSGTNEGHGYAIIKQHLNVFISVSVDDNAIEAATH